MQKLSINTATQQRASRWLMSVAAICLGLVLFSSHAALATNADTLIDFNRQRVVVQGLGGMPWEEETSYEQERARAWMDAVHHAYEVILDLPLSAGIKVRNAIQRNPQLKQRLGLVLRATNPVFRQPDISGLVRCDLEIPFYGALSLRSALYLAALSNNPVGPYSIRTDLEKIQAEDGNEDEDKEQQGTDPAKATIERIVVDVRSTPFTPSLFPRFFNATRSRVFQEAMIPAPERFSRPVVRFTENVRRAYTGLAEEKVKFIIATAETLQGYDVIIPDHEADEFFKLADRLLKDPMRAGEILIVYKRTDRGTGVMPLTEEGE